LRADRRLDVGLALLAEGEPQAAAAAIRTALELAPKAPQLWYALGEAEATAGRKPSAARAFRRCLRLAPEDALGAGPQLALLGAAPLPDRLPPAHVEKLFDEYAPRFERALVDGLGYCAPARLRAALLAEAAASGAADLGRWRALDLGCGTGLAGAALKDLTGRLEGVDLSARMLAKARARGLYDELAQGDLLEALELRAGPYDLIVAADVLIYLGDLASLFARVARRLAPGGRFAFTLEKADAPGWHLQESRRYAHHPIAIAAWAAAADLEIAHWEEGAWRRDRSRPVPSLLHVLRPCGSAAHSALAPDAAKRGPDRLDA
jgi:predicted TPR repeat methyltransferase